MLQSQIHLDQTIDQMRAMAQQLIPYTPPQGTDLDAQDVAFFKQQTLYVDGYDVILHFSIQDYGDLRIERLEVISQNTPFLPMFLVCKIAARFLGKHELRYSESFKMGRKVYVWTIGVDERGRPLALPNIYLEKCSYEHFDYSCVTSIR